MNYKVCELLE